MKKFFALVCAAALLFALGTAFAEPIKFPNGLTVDVAPGWFYEGEDDNIVLIAEDQSCAITITVVAAEGVTGRDAAFGMSKEHGGSEPQEIGEDFYFYSFQNENGVECRVFVGAEDGKLKVISITGDHQDVEDILNSIEE